MPGPDTCSLLIPYSYNFILLRNSIVFISQISNFITFHSKHVYLSASSNIYFPGIGFAWIVFCGCHCFSLKWHSAICCKLPSQNNSLLKAKHFEREISFRQKPLNLCPMFFAGENWSTKYIVKNVYHLLGLIFCIVK